MQYPHLKSIGRAISDSVYSQVSIIVLAHGGPARGSFPRTFLLRKQSHFLTDSALRAVMAKTNSWDETDMQTRRRLGDICYEAMDGEQCVHYSWVTQQQRSIVEIGYHASLLKDMWWIYDCYTAPTHRGRSIFPHVLSTIAQDAATARARALWIDVEETNVRSQRAMTKAGFIPAAVLSQKVLLSSVVLDRSRTALANPWGNLFDQMPFFYAHANQTH
jgi:RimJ/RimL family protein N-acetyltransferase